MRKELEEKYRLQSKLLSQLREETLSRVANWIYTRADLWSSFSSHPPPEPHFEDSLPTSEDAEYACGFDLQNRLILVQQFASELSDQQSQPDKLVYVLTRNILVNEFITYESDHIITVSRFLAGRLIFIRRVIFADGRQVEVQQVLHGYYSRSQFFYEGSLVSTTRIVTDEGRILTEILHPRGEPARYYRVRRDGTRFQLYQPLPKGVTLKKLLEKIHSRLLTLIPETIQNADINEPIYCVALAYDGEGNGVLPPSLAVGLESERQRWLREHGRKARDYIWNPAEFSNYETSALQFNDDELEEAFDLAATALASRDSERPAIKLLIEVAAQLNRRPWPPEIQITPDFVVYPIDLELGSLKRNLKAAVPSEKFRVIENLI